MDLPATRTAEGIALQVWLTPKSSSARVEGAADRGGRTVLKVLVTAAPEDGKANAALLAVLAEWLGLPKSSLSIQAGHKSRLKAVLVAGRPDELLKEVTLLLGAKGTAASRKAER